MIEHVAAVRGRTVTWDDRRVVQHGMGADRVVLDLDAEWDACDRIQVALACASLEKPVRVIPEGRAFLLPAQMLLVPGQLRMQVIGYEGDSVRLMTKREASPLVVVESGAYDGAVPPEPDQPDLWAKLMADVEAATKAASSAAGAATQAAQAAEAAAKSATDAAAKAESAASSTMEGELRRVRAEASRVEAEKARAAAESARAGAEDKRAASESARTKAETARDAAEKSREAAEQRRAAATEEAVKKAADAAAKADEAATDAAAGEQGRVTAEHGRAEAEKARVAAEADRAKRADAAIAAAGEAAASATSAANKAESAVAQLPIPSGNVLKGEAESTFINLHDSWKAPILKGKVLGQSNQITTKGINLVNHANPLDASGNVPFRGEKLKNGFVIDSLPDTANDNRIATMKVLGGIKAGDTIVVSCNYRKLSGNIEIPSFCLPDAPQEYGIAINKPLTVKNNHSLIGVYVDADSNSKIEITDFQLIKSSQPLAYEPFTGGEPSPSPDCPQKITNLNKSELVITGRNICPDAELLGGVSYNSGIPTNKFGIQAKFPYVQPSETYGIGAVLNTIKGVTYSIAYLGKANTAAVGIAEYKSADDVVDIGKVVSYARVGSSKKNSLTASIDGVMVFVIASQWSNGTTNINTFAKEDMIISIGEPCSTYTPHQSKNTAIDLQGNELCSLPNGVRDEVVIDAEGNVSLIKRLWKLSRRIGDMNNSENYPGWQCANAELIDAVGSGIDIQPRGMSTHFQRFSINTKGVTERGGIIYVTGYKQSELIANYPDEVVTFIGERKEPQTIPLGKVELPALPEATSTVWNNGNIPANVYVQYLKDVNIAFADLESKLTQAVVAAVSNI